MPQSSFFHPLRPLTLASLFLWLTVTVLLIAAAALPQLTMTSNGDSLGAFQICFPANDWGGISGCYAIDANCDMHYNGVGESLATGDACVQLQATRAFLTTGVLLAGCTTALAYYMFFQHRMAHRRLRRAAHWLMGLESCFILVAFCVASAFIDNADHEFAYGGRGNSFTLMVVAWPLGLAAWALWAAAGRYEKEAAGGVVAAGSAATVAVEPPKVAEVQPPVNAQSVVFPSGQQPQPMYGAQPYQPAYQQQQPYQHPYPQQPNQQQPYPQQYQPQPPQYQPQYQPQYAAQQPFYPQQYQPQPYPPYYAPRQFPPQPQYAQQPLQPQPPPQQPLYQPHPPLLPPPPHQPLYQPHPPQEPPPPHQQVEPEQPAPEQPIADEINPIAEQY